MRYSLDIAAPIVPWHTAIAHAAAWLTYSRHINECDIHNALIDIRVRYAVLHTYSVSYKCNYSALVSIYNVSSNGSQGAVLRKETHAGIIENAFEVRLPTTTLNWDGIDEVADVSERSKVIFDTDINEIDNYLMSKQISSHDCDGSLRLCENWQKRIEAHAEKCILAKHGIGQRLSNTVSKSERVSLNNAVSDILVSVKLIPIYCLSVSVQNNNILLTVPASKEGRAWLQGDFTTDKISSETQPDNLLSLIIRGFIDSEFIKWIKLQVFKTDLSKVSKSRLQDGINLAKKTTERLEAQAETRLGSFKLVPSSSLDINTIFSNESKHRKTPKALHVFLLVYIFPLGMLGLHRRLLGYSNWKFMPGLLFFGITLNSLSDGLGGVLITSNLMWLMIDILRLFMGLLNLADGTPLRGGGIRNILPFLNRNARDLSQ